MMIFDEYDDRFEKNLFIDGLDVCISMDKPITKSAIAAFGSFVDKTASDLLTKSVAYINQLKAESGIGYIDDLSDPQIIGNEDTVSVYWSSDKGESNGESVIGVDFRVTNLIPYNLTIGD